MEISFGQLEEDPDDAVEFLLVEVLDGDPARQIHVTVGAERKASSVQVVIAAQQERVQSRQPCLVFGGREEIDLVAQRSLMQVEIDGRGIATIAPEPDVPTAKLGLVLDVLDRRLGRDGSEQVPIEKFVDGGDRSGLGAQRHETGSRASRSV